MVPVGGRPTDHRCVFVDALRALGAVRSLPDVDALSIADKEAARAAASPWLLEASQTVLWLSCPTCRFSATSDERPTYATSPRIPKIIRYLAIHRGVGDSAFTTLSYFDGVKFRQAGLRACLVFSGAYGPGLPAVDGVCRVSRVWRRKRTSSFTRSMTMEGLAAQQRLVGPTVDIKTR